MTLREKYIRVASLISILGAVDTYWLGKYLAIKEKEFQLMIAGFANDGLYVRRDGSVISNSKMDDTEENIRTSISILKILHYLSCKLENISSTNGPAKMTIILNQKLYDVFPVRKELIGAINAIKDFVPDDSHRIFIAREKSEVADIEARVKNDIVFFETEEGIGLLQDLRQIKENNVD